MKHKHQHRKRKPLRKGKKPRRKPPARRTASTSKGAPEQTFKEGRYLKHLAGRKVPVLVRTWGDEEYEGVVDYYDKSFIRLTRADGPNLFLFKSDIKYLSEQPSESSA